MCSPSEITHPLTYSVTRALTLLINKSVNQSDKQIVDYSNAGPGNDGRMGWRAYHDAQFGTTPI